MRFTDKELCAGALSLILFTAVIGWLSLKFVIWLFSLSTVMAG